MTEVIRRDIQDLYIFPITLLPCPLTPYNVTLILSVNDATH